jgi:DNA-directed RNA polymerase specialized sigma24 family protein
MGVRVEDRAASASFEAAVFAPLDAAYNLARGLTREDHAAEDVVPEAYLRASRSSELPGRGRQGMDPGHLCAMPASTG